MASGGEPVHRWQRSLAQLTGSASNLAPDAARYRPLPGQSAGHHRADRLRRDAVAVHALQHRARRPKGWPVMPYRRTGGDLTGSFELPCQDMARTACRAGENSVQARPAATRTGCIGSRRTGSAACVNLPSASAGCIPPTGQYTVPVGYRSMQRMHANHVDISKMQRVNFLLNRLGLPQTHR